MTTLLFAIAGAAGAAFKAWFCGTQRTVSKQSALDVVTGAVVGSLFNLLLPSLPDFGIPGTALFVELFSKANVAQQAVLIAVFSWFASDALEGALGKFGVKLPGSNVLPPSPFGNAGSQGIGTGGPIPPPATGGGIGMRPRSIIAVLVMVPLVVMACASGKGGYIAGPLEQYKAFVAALQKGLPPGDPLLACAVDLGKQLDSLDAALTKPQGPTAIGTTLGDAFVLARRTGAVVALPGGGSLGASSLTPTACDALNGMVLRLAVQNLSPIKLNP